MYYLRNKGFTIIELLVAVTIIVNLSTISVFYLQGTREKAKIAKARSMVVQLHKILSVNYQESGGTSPVNDNTSIGTNCTYWTTGTVRGFVHNQGDYYEGWMGPWMHEVPKDPWGNCYALDGVVDEGCPNDGNGSKVCSAGPNGTFESWNGLPVSRGDDICKSLGCP